MLCQIIVPVSGEINSPAWFVACTFRMSAPTPCPRMLHQFMMSVQSSLALPVNEVCGTSWRMWSICLLPTEQSLVSKILAILLPNPETKHNSRKWSLIITLIVVSVSADEVQRNSDQLECNSMVTVPQYLLWMGTHSQRSRKCSRHAVITFFGKLYNTTIDSRPPTSKASQCVHFSIP